MNGVNNAATAIFNVLLTPLEMIGDLAALILVSGIFGIIALLVFKQISWQGGIKATKDKIKGHMIAIRIYQDDLGVVGMSVGKVVFRNFQYLGLNFAPILPLLFPFTLVAAQLVVRYGFDPIEVTELEGRPADQVMSGKGTIIEVSMKKGHEAEIVQLSLELPDGFEAVSPLVRNGYDGVAFLEVIATRAVEDEIEILLGGERVGTKKIVAGDERTRLMQPERVSSFWTSWLWPAEETFPGDCPIGTVSFVYPDRTLLWVFSGAFGVLLLFLVASLAFGILILKPLNIQI
jgi:hypothetical protein